LLDPITRGEWEKRLEVFFVPLQQLTGILSVREKSKLIFDENRHCPVDTICQQSTLVTSNFFVSRILKRKSLRLSTYSQLHC
jgi:hypothetical protein